LAVEGARGARVCATVLRSQAPSTMLRMVPLPRCAGEEFRLCGVHLPIALLLLGCMPSRSRGQRYKITSEKCFT